MQKTVIYLKKGEWVRQIATTKDKRIYGPAKVTEITHEDGSRQQIVADWDAVSLD